MKRYLDDLVMGDLERKLADATLHRALANFAERFAGVEAVQLVQHLRQEEQRGRVRVTEAADWLAGLAA